MKKVKEIYHWFHYHVGDIFRLHPYCFTFLSGCLLALLMMMPNIIAGGGIFSWIADYTSQEIPFNVHLGEIMRDGGETWEPHSDLGVSTVGAYSFYNLASPFMVVLWIFPAKAVPYLLGLMYIVKYGIACLTAFLFLGRMVKNKKYALLGGILYAFSGFQLTNMLFYHFHDCVALFPLMLYALDRLIKDNKRVLFILVVALNLFTNYFFFIGEVVFLLIYFVILCLTKYYKFTWKKFFEIALESILGVGLGCVILAPSLLFVAQNPRVQGAWTLKSALFPGTANILEVIRAFILPNDSMSPHSLIQPHNWNSFEAYLPFVGSVLWLAYIIKNPKKPFSILAIILGVFLLIPILNSSFVAFSTTMYYARWLYMFILILSLLSIKTLEERINIKPGIIAVGVAMIVFFSIAVFTISRGETFIYNEKYFLVMLIALLCSIIVLACSKRENLFAGCLIGTCVYIIAYGGYFCWLHRTPGAVDSFEQEQELLREYSENVRYNEKYYNGNYFAHRMGVTNWNSNAEGSTFEFYESVGLPRGVAIQIPFEEETLQDFLSVQYLVSTEELDETLPYKFLERNGNFLIYENEDYLPLGIDYDAYITIDEFNQLDAADRREVLEDAVVLSDEQADKYDDALTKYNNEGRESKLTKNDFRLIKNGFEANIELMDDALVVYTFAYSDNFQAILNDEPVEIEKVDNGLIGIKMPKGENHLRVIYEDKGLKIGAIISAVSAIGTIVYIVVLKSLDNSASKQKKKKSA